ncbi:hypothetical protein ACFLUJ_06895 [Chloroflexota bacterium]
MLQRKWIVFLCSLLVISMTITGCSSLGSTEPEETTEASTITEPEEITEPLETTEDKDITRLEVEASIAGWLPLNVDNTSDTIGALVTSDTPIAKDIASKVIKTALLTELDVTVEHTSPLEGEDKYTARVVLGFPILLELPILGAKEYWVSIGYDFIIEGGQVVDADIDASSFEMKASND